jgi:hypothetical protein
MTLPFLAEFKKMSPIIDDDATISSSLLHATDVTDPKCDRSVIGTYLVLLFISQILTTLSAPPAAIYLEFDEKAHEFTDTTLLGSNDTSKAA